MAVRSSSQALVRGRIALAAGFCAAAFVLVGLRLVDVMALRGGTGVVAETASPASGARADLVDRHGLLLARDLPIVDLEAKPSAFWNPAEAAHVLAAATGADEARLLAQFAEDRKTVTVKRALTPDEQDAVMRLGLPGLTFRPSLKRIYPGGRALAHVVGQVDIDRDGVSGLEFGLDTRLRGDAAKPVALSVDLRVQHVLARELGATLEKFKANAGGGIVLDVVTGEILALVSLPDFEPNLRRLKPGDSQRNRIAQDAYELGSVFKIFAFAQAMEEQTVRLDERIDVGHPLRVGRFSIRDSHRLGPMLTAAHVFAQSSNIGTARIALRAGAARQRAFLSRLGLLAPVRTELPEAREPLTPRRWKDVETATVAFGHGVSVSPLSFAAAVASVVNGGTRIVPTFLKRESPQNGERVLSERASLAMRELLHLVVTEGTGKNAAVAGYRVGGKTGTAEKATRRGYSRKSLISSFCGVFPIDAPRYLVFVVVDEPKGTKDTYGYATAGYTAAPLVSRVIGRIAPLLGVMRSDGPFVDASNS